MFAVVQVPNSVLHIVQAHDDRLSEDSETAVHWAKEVAKMLHLLHGFLNSVVYGCTQGWPLAGLRLAAAFGASLSAACGARAPVRPTLAMASESAGGSDKASRKLALPSSASPAGERAAQSASDDPRLSSAVDVRVSVLSS